MTTTEYNEATACRLLQSAVFDPKNMRIIEGIAVTAAKTAVGQVNPLGGEWALPIPLLLDHDSSRPAGWVTHAWRSASGVTFTAKVANAGLPGIEWAWDCIRLGRTAAVSAYVRNLDPLSAPRAGDPASAHYYRRWAWDELSVLAIGADPGALIHVAKEITALPRPIIYFDGRPTLRATERHYHLLGAAQ